MTCLHAVTLIKKRTVDEHSVTSRRRKAEEPKRDQFRMTRQWLNIIFMVGAIAGLLVYFLSDHRTGIIVILAAMVFKIVECALRMVR